MISLFKKEFLSYFSNLTGYLASGLFLLINSLFLFVFPNDMNVLYSGYATLDTFFGLSPWIFLFLVPAVTMRSFAEESDKGTLDLLLTRPLSLLQIVTAKYAANLSVVLVSILPAILFVISIYLLGNPIGNIDMGATIGSFIGLFLLAAIYTAIGLFTSTIANNQIVAFLLAVILSFLLYTGFEYISGLFLGIENIIGAIGIQYHYESVSRGVIDSRDIVYYITLIYLFLISTRLMLEKRNW